MTLGLFAQLGGGEWNVETWRFITGLVATASLLAIGHLFPWPRRLRQIESYTYGVASILIGYAIWLGLGGTFWRLCAFAVAGGVVVGLLYWYEATRNAQIRARSSDVQQDH